MDKFYCLQCDTYQSNIVAMIYGHLQRACYKIVQHSYFFFQVIVSYNDYFAVILILNTC